MMVCAQFLLSGVDWDPTCLGYWIDERVAPGGYAWVFPKGEGRANVGLGVQADLAEATALAYLNRFVESEPCLAAGSPVTLVAGNVPVAPPCERLVTEGLMLVGDAGRLVDPLTGGGIIHAMFAGRMAAQVAIEAIDERDRSAARLADYEAQLQVKLGRSLARRQHVRQEFSPSERASRRFVRIFALAAGGQ
jgi:digeranylgeranylglycerophospholipid reductase